MSGVERTKLKKERACARGRIKQKREGGREEEEQRLFFYLHINVKKREDGARERGRDPQRVECWGRSREALLF